MNADKKPLKDLTPEEIFEEIILMQGSQDMTDERKDEWTYCLLRDWREQYASTKAEEVAIEFYGYMVSAPDEDINDKTIYEVFDEWFTQYKQQ